MKSTSIALKANTHKVFISPVSKNQANVNKCDFSPFLNSLSLGQVHSVQLSEDVRTSGNVAIPSVSRLHSSLGSLGLDI